MDVAEAPKRARIKSRGPRIVEALEALADELAHNPTLHHNLVLQLRALQRTKKGPLTDFLEAAVGGLEE